MVGLTKEGIGGHAMICYRIKDGKPHIADPNYPGDLDRRIEYEADKLKPMNRESTAKPLAGNSISFDKIGYTGKTSIIDWNKIRQRWIEFKAAPSATTASGIYCYIYE